MTYRQCIACVSWHFCTLKTCFSSDKINTLLFIYVL
uniref:Uncharacterized protein n=1 Tax=Anguilla anguilla TaxID=7936 RepID=A0A0E9Q8W4_ANGAN